MKTIYILHGWVIDSQNGKKWQEFIALLRTYQLNPKFLGLPGLSIPLNKPWNLNDYVSWLNKQLPNEPVILLGHSFGGQLAIRFAAKYPQKISKLILIDSAGVRDSNFLSKIKRLVFFVMAKAGKLIFRHNLFKKILYKAAGTQDYIKADAVMKKTLKRVLADEIIRDLPKINCPALIIWGKNDTITPINLGFRFKKNLKNSRITIVSQARHAPQFTHARKVARIIAGFLGQPV